MTLPRPFSREDIISEYFIHRDLQERAERIAQEVRDGWKKTQHVEPFAITWPKEGLTSDDGSQIEQAVLCRLPESLTDARRLEVLKGMVERTKAYGLVLVLAHPDSIHVLFETQHGARAWLTRLERHGDVTVCLPPTVRENAECVGLLWRPTHSATTRK